ncbi:hypothetical protein ACKVMH_00850 [Lysobacter zhanggongensis]|uniref:Uncharacterized protein n=1 Tax=Lysobacter zhanggongensis TaxID=1774951 RepID=A0ABU7YLK8_9GAMM
MDSAGIDKLRQELLESIVSDAFSQGIISSEDISGKRLAEKVLELIKHAHIEVIIDHRESILEAAIAYLKKDQPDFSLLVFATYFEHSINYILATALRKRKIQQKTLIEIIRSLTLEAKTGWAFELLELPVINPAHRKVILAVANERNSFVHYKWKPNPDEPTGHDKEDARLTVLLTSARKSVTYIRMYESRYIFAKHKKAIRSAVRAP